MMRLDDAKKLRAIDLLNHIHRLVKQNTSQIKANNRLIKMAIKNQESHEMNQTLHKVTNESKKLAHENTQYMELHTKLLCFLKSLKNESGSELNLNMNKSKPAKHHFNNYLEKTISGEMKFNKHHPLFYNKEFRNKLIEYFSSLEEYEICAELLKL